MLSSNIRLRFAILGTLWLFGAASLSTAAERLASDEAVAPRTLAPPQIDGDLSDPVWQTAARVENFIDPKSGVAPFRATWMKALHDDRYLYFAVWCAEPQPEKLAEQRRKEEERRRKGDRRAYWETGAQKRACPPFFPFFLLPFFFSPVLRPKHGQDARATRQNSCVGRLDRTTRTRTAAISLR
jgi:hypothetical protein